MELTERKKRILQAIVETYIETAEPVGSKVVAEKARLDVSTATIRNEMSDLESMGLLEQPHTSAGRVPSPKGYRLYVNELMEHSWGQKMVRFYDLDGNLIEVGTPIN